ncbi:MAG TPA: branched-chain amino acid ABC transporter permease, partial [Gaiella sp.]
NEDSLTGGSQGTIALGPVGQAAQYNGQWESFQNRVQGWLGFTSKDATMLVIVWIVALVALTLVWLAVRTPWGRVLKAIREDEDAAEALGKNTFAYKLQSLSIAAALAAIAGYMLAINISILSPTSFDPVITAYGYVIVILGGLGSYLGVVVGSFFLIFLLEATRYLELPLSDARVAALRFVIVGLVLMALVIFRPQGVFGKREELMLRARR